MNRKKRLQKIDDFFEKVSVEEFDAILIKAGINDLKSSEEFGMELFEPIFKYPNEEIYSTKEQVINTKNSKYTKFDKNKFNCLAA